MMMKRAIPIATNRLNAYKYSKFNCILQVFLFNKTLQLQYTNNIHKRFVSSQNADIENIKAQQILKDAITELSDSSSMVKSNDSSSNALEWSTKPIEELTVDQLEELGRAYFEGVDDVIEINLEKAVYIWGEAANKGSIEAKYSRAVCLREGLGIMKDSEISLKEMLELADKHDYYLAHYAVGIMLTNTDDKKSLDHFQKAALGGMTIAFHNVANAYAYGKGVEQNYSEAIKYYEAAIETNDPFSKFTLGTWLYKGLGGLKVDKNRSFQLQLEAAEQGHPSAMFNTGSAYMEGIAIKQNFLIASEWFQKASSHGIIEANINLGNLYRLGQGVPKDLIKARDIFAKYANTHKLSAELVEITEEQIINEKYKK